MRYDTRLGKYGGKPRLGGLRATLCISSQVCLLLFQVMFLFAQIICNEMSLSFFFFQVGCKMGCRFCATGSMGFKSNLSSGEIVEQLVYASSFAQIRNVVFMVITFLKLSDDCLHKLLENLASLFIASVFVYD